MAKLIDDIKGIKKDIKNGRSVKLPYFEKQNGAWVYNGRRVEVRTLEELNRYLSSYEEIKDYIKNYFSNSISKIYARSLNNLTSYPSKKSRISVWLEKDSVAIENLQNTFEEDHNNLRHISSAINTNLFGRFRPFDPAVLSARFLGGSKFDGIAYLLPEFTDSGVRVIAKGDKISTNLIGVSEDEYYEIYKYIDSVIQNLPEETRDELREKVDYLFKTSKHLASCVTKPEENGEAYYTALEMVKTATNIFGDDPQTFLKKPKKQKQLEDIKAIDDRDAHIDDVPNNKINVSSIKFNTGYATGLENNGGNIVIKLTPVNGIEFSVEFDEKASSLIIDNAKEKSLNM